MVWQAPHAGSYVPFEPARGTFAKAVNKGWYIGVKSSGKGKVRYEERISLLLREKTLAAECNETACRNRRGDVASIIGG
jgi:hypothetical protein